jgi:hypothetical protein
MALMRKNEGNQGVAAFRDEFKVPLSGRRGSIPLAISSTASRRPPRGGGPPAASPAAAAAAAVAVVVAAAAEQRGNRAARGQALRVHFIAGRSTHTNTRRPRTGRPQTPVPPGFGTTSPVDLVRASRLRAALASSDQLRSAGWAGLPVGCVHGCSEVLELKPEVRAQSFHTSPGRCHLPDSGAAHERDLLAVW